MAEKFRNKYRVPSARLVGWDYRDDAMYFITICCKDRKHFFGRIEKGKMILSESGKLCEKYLFDIPEHFPFVLLDAAIVMPNHLHAIVVIDRGIRTDVACHPGTDVACHTGTDVACHTGTDVACHTGTDVACHPGTDVACHPGTDVACNVSTGGHMAAISPKPGSLSTILRSFKSAVKKDARAINPDFNWHPRFHDHIIRNGGSHQRIKKYIENNPLNWDQDKFRG